MYSPYLIVFYGLNLSYFIFLYPVYPTVFLYLIILHPVCHISYPILHYLVILRPTSHISHSVFLYRVTYPTFFIPILHSLPYYSISHILHSVFLCRVIYPTFFILYIFYIYIFYIPRLILYIHSLSRCHTSHILYSIFHILYFTSESNNSIVPIRTHKIITEGVDFPQDFCWVATFVAWQSSQMTISPRATRISFRLNLRK